MNRLVVPFVFFLKRKTIYNRNPFLLLQSINFGSKKQKEKVDKEQKKLRKILKVSGNLKEVETNENVDEKIKKKLNDKNKIDYKTHDVKIDKILTSFDNKIKNIFDNTLKIDFFNNIEITKDKKNMNLSDVTQVVIKSSQLIHFYPYISTDIQKIIYALKKKNNTWNPTISNDNQYIVLQLLGLTEEMKLKKKKEAKDLFEKTKTDVRNIRHKIKDEIVKNIEGEEWKIFEKNKLDNYIKNKIKLVENVYEKAIKSF
ncbi:ribosome-recycling factor, putative [Hepatocystis sp. ex Piliocolobus tephrosceles]|nr:ribosome-recycling factor, putative [Hepatocystis sp. ex Piliocolobus tephrosceles]